MIVSWRRVRSDSVQSDQKSVQEEAEEEAEASLDKKLPGEHIMGQTGTRSAHGYVVSTHRCDFG